MEQKRLRHLFQNNLRQALDEHYTGWQIRVSADRELELPEAETLLAWTRGESKIQPSRFKRFVNASKFPPETRRSLLDLYQQLSHTWQKDSQRLSNSTESGDKQDAPTPLSDTVDVTVTPNSDIETPQSISSTSLPIPFKNRNLTTIFAFGILLTFAIMCVSLVAIVIYLNQKTDNWCVATPAEIGFIGTVGQIYFSREASVGDFEVSQYFIYFNFGRSNQEYVGGDAITFEGFDTDSNQWLFTLSQQWINNHPNWNERTLWKVSYQC